MKKTIRFIFYGFIIYIFPCSTFGQSVTVSRNLSETFTSNSLKNSDIEMFEKRAIQKIEDFVNYCEIISDMNYDLSLRKHAIEMALAMFVDENCSFVISDKLSGTTEKIPIGEYLNSLLNSEFVKISTKANNITTLKEFQKDKLGSYKGTMFFSQTLTVWKSETESVKNTDIDKEIGIILKKEKKKFGREKMDIWEVFLGDVEFNE